MNDEISNSDKTPVLNYSRQQECAFSVSCTGLQLQCTVASVQASKDKSVISLNRLDPEVLGSRVKHKSQHLDITNILGVFSLKFVVTRYCSKLAGPVRRMQAQNNNH